MLASFERQLFPILAYCAFQTKYNFLGRLCLDNKKRLIDVVWKANTSEANPEERS